MKIQDLKIDPSEQGSFAWRKARLGKFTASMIGDIIGRGKGKDAPFSLTGIGAIAEKAAERELLPEVLDDEDTFQWWSDLQFTKTRVMQFGNDKEEEARIRYEIESGNTVTQVGLVDDIEIPYFAASPDGLVLDGDEVEGMIEIKCPQGQNFVVFKWQVSDGLSLKATKAAYYWQIQTNLAITGARWCDFVIYSPFYRTGIKIVRIDRNEDDIATVRERVITANKYIEDHE